MKRAKKKLHWIDELADTLELPLMRVDGYDDCCLGIVECFGQPPRLCYDLGKMRERLIAEGASYEEAVEHLDFNVLGAYVGEHTPAFLELQPACHELQPACHELHRREEK